MFNSNGLHIAAREQETLGNAQGGLAAICCAYRVRMYW